MAQLYERALRIHDACAHMIWHASDESQLLRGLCRELVEAGGYKMAWIGWAMYDPEKTVKPVAWYGMDASYLENLDVRWDENHERGRGPTGTAIRTGKSIVQRDIAGSGPDYPWREEAVKRGFLSSIAVPICVATRPVQQLGALNIYAAEKDAFDDFEAQVLERIAAYLSSALTAMRERRARERVEEEQKRIESNFRSLFQNMLDGVVLCKIVKSPGDETARAICLEANQAFEEITGIRRDEVIGEELAQFLPEVVADVTGTPPVGAVQWRGPAKKELHLKRLGKKRLGKWIRYSVVSPEAGYATLIFEDVTREIVAHKALKEAATRYQELFDYAPVGYHEIDMRGRICRINRTELQLLGYRKKELLGKPIWMIIAGGEGEDKLRHELLAGEPVRSTYDMTLMAKDGSPIPVRAHNVSIVDSRGNLIGLRTAIEDLRETMVLERRLRKAERLEAVGRLAAGIAHDFNNVLTAISGYAQLISSTLNKEDPVQEDIEQIRIAVERASRLTRQLLTFAKRQPMSPKVLDVNQSLREMEKLLRKLTREDVVLEMVLDEGTGCVEMDPSQFEQIVINLVVNARDAMPNGGRLQIRTTCTELRKSLWTATGQLKKGRYVVLSVSDTGIGMDEETQSRIFEPFFTTKGSGSGTGLGLATVYGIVSAMGGSINVDSQVGKGTRFEIYLPRTEKEPAPTEGREQVLETQIGKGELVLLVDDDKILRNLLARFLKDGGFRVLSAEDGVKALELFAANMEDISIVVTDVVMPRLGGIELSNKLRELKPDIPIIFMSGYLDTENLPTIAGRDVFIWKPFSPAQLVQRVVQTLGRGNGTSKPVN